MTEEIKITLPKLGESILNATIVKWFKKEGDLVQLDEPLLEVSTDKVNSEIPSPAAGVLKEILAQPDQELSVGDALAVIAKAGGHTVSSHAPIQKKETVQASDSRAMQGFFSPALLRLAQESGVSMQELEKIQGTGEGGRLTRKDLEAYVQSKSKPCPMTKHSGDVERIKMTGMRKAIADNMVRSFYEAPHASLVTQVDVTDVLATIEREKETFLTKHGAKLTITSFIARAIVRALQEFPLLNASLEQDTIVMKRFINLGIAVSVDQGLMVPVIKNCQAMNFPALAKAVGELAAKARASKLQPDDVKEGTITMSNFGMSGVLMGVPIIRYPEVAIIGVGAIQKQAVPQEDGQIAVRSMVHISLTFDHRVLDGMYGCSFLNALKKHLEQDLALV
jgi:2-oxoglutarate dehydrogenase E2 component (dihydrolipoamide succinyltransferase)